MVDKGFLIEKEVEEIGLQLNIPPFARANKQMPHADVEMTKRRVGERGTSADEGKGAVALATGPPPCARPWLSPWRHVRIHYPQFLKSTEQLIREVV